jgi:hypothetical protein
MCKETAECELPDCRGIKSKILNRFAAVMLHIFSKGRQCLRKEKEVESYCHEMFSRSMEMRKSVSGIKKTETTSMLF